MAPRTLAGLSTVLSSVGNVAEALNAFARLAERRAREEAVRTLEELTRSLNDEHARAVADLQRKLSEAQAALNGKGTSDSIRVTQLKRAIEVAAAEARVTAQRLSAVEEQVRVAVT